MDWKKNKAAIIGLVLSANGLIISFTGYGVILSIVGLCFCLAGLSVKKANDSLKVMAAVGLIAALVSFPIAIRVSDSNLSTNEEEVEESAMLDEDWYLESRCDKMIMI